MRKKDISKIDWLYECCSLGSKWDPIPVKVDRSVGRPGDFPSLYGFAPVFSERAWVALEPLIRDHVEVLPLSHPAGPHYLINILSVVDCLDHSRSEIKRFSNGQVMRVAKYAFRPEVALPPIFRLPETFRGEVLLTEEFRSHVEDAGLEGLRFVPLPQ